jgi:hypothetical protein
MVTSAKNSHILILSTPAITVIGSPIIGIQASNKLATPHFSKPCLALLKRLSEILRTRCMLSGAFIDYAFYRIMQTIRKSTRPGEPITPTMIYLEEFWFLIEVPAFRKKVRDWLKTLAKLNAFLVMTTQSLEDMVSSDAKFFASLRDNIPTKIFLPNAKAKTEKLYNLYTREFGLDDGYVDLIQKGIPKRDYLVVTDEYAKQIICQFGESSLAVLRSDTKAQAVFDEHYLKTPDWKKRYIYEVIGEVLPEETTEQQPGEAA